MPSKWRSVASFVNFFPWTSYTHEYHKLVPRRDFYIQLALSFVGAALSIWLITVAMEVAISTPLVTQETELFPTPERMLELFGMEGSVVGLTCPCNSTTTPFGKVSTVEWNEDVFCSTLRADVRRFAQPNSNIRGYNPGNLQTSDLRWAMGEDMGEIVDGGRDSPNSEAPTCFAVQERPFITGLLRTLFNTTLITDDFFQYIEESVCAGVFGLSRVDRLQAPQPPPATATFGQSKCRQRNSFGFSSDGILSFPPIFSPISTSSFQSWVQLKETRFTNLLTSSALTCDTLHAAANRFLVDISDVPLNAKEALSPIALEQLSKTTFMAVLATRAQSFFPSQQNDEIFNPLWSFLLNDSPFEFISIQNSFYFNLPGVIPRLTLQSDSRIFSSELPFVRTDSPYGGGQFFLKDMPLRIFFPKSQFQGPSSTGYFRSEGSSIGSFPLFFGDYDIFKRSNNPGLSSIDSLFSTSRSFFSSNDLFNSSAVPVGNDFLSLLDACANNETLFMQINGIDPLYMNSGFDNPDNYRWPWKPSQFFNVSSSTDFSGQFCRLYSSGRDFPQTVLANISLTCPKTVTYLGKLRQSSSYFKLKSRVKISRNDFFSQFDDINITDTGFVDNPQGRFLLCVSIGYDIGNSSKLNVSLSLRNFCTRFVASDAQDRANVYSNLMLDLKGPVLNTSALNHYATCKPSTCTYTLIRPRSTEELALEAVGIYGGNVSAILSALAFIAFCLSAANQYFEGSEVAKKQPSPSNTIAAWGEPNPLNQSLELTGLSNSGKS